MVLCNGWMTTFSSKLNHRGQAQENQVDAGPALAVAPGKRTRVSEQLEANKSKATAGPSAVSELAPVKQPDAPFGHFIGEHIGSRAERQPTDASQTSRPSSIPSDSRSRLERASGFDLSDVRIHTGPAAAAAADAENARAFTKGDDITFNAGEFDPTSSLGQHLLAHEVGHVVQQRGGTPVVARKRFRDLNETAGSENEADAFADAFVAGRTTPTMRPASIGVARKGKHVEKSPSTPSAIELVKFRRSDTAGVLELSPEHVVLGDEVYAEFRLDAPLSSEIDSKNFVVESSGQLNVLESGQVDGTGLRLYFRATAVKKGSQPTFFRAWPDSGAMLEQAMWFEVVDATELRDRVLSGNAGGGPGQVRGPISQPSPHDGRGSKQDAKRRARNRKGMRPDAPKVTIPTTNHHKDRHAASTGGLAEHEGVGYSYANAELDRGESMFRTKAAVAHYVDGVEGKEIGNALPQPLPALVGSVGYYRARYDDFARRNPGLEPPDYYLEYGAKYARTFSRTLFPELSGQGQVWLIAARLLLQLAFENRLLADAAAFADLERKSGSLKKFAFESHAGAYLQAGLAGLDLADQTRIGLHPSLRDVLSPAGLKQVMAALPRVVRDKMKGVRRDVAAVPGKIERSMFDRKQWGIF